jgi:hypothetical protein
MLSKIVRADASQCSLPPLLVILVSLSTTGCAKLFSGVVGQPDAMKGSIPLRISDPPAVSEGNFAKPVRYSICDLTVITPDGTGQGHSWFGGLVAPPPRAGESRDYKIKPGRYRVEAKACMDANSRTDWSNSWGHIDLDLVEPTEIVVVAPGVQTPASPTNGSRLRILRTGHWKRCVYDPGTGWETCDR